MTNKQTTDNKMSRLVTYLTEHGEQHDRPNGQLYTMFSADDRYLVDFAPDFAASGWMQFDTDQDAHYFGAWVNPRRRLTLSYAEGDWALMRCLNRSTYNAEVDRWCEFYGEGQVATVIDDDGVTIVRQDRATFYAGINS